MLQIRVTLITRKVGQKKDPGILECFLIVNILSLSDEKPILSYETRTIIVFNLGKKNLDILNDKEVHGQWPVWSRSYLENWQLADYWGLC